MADSDDISLFDLAVFAGSALGTYRLLVFAQASIANLSTQGGGSTYSPAPSSSGGYSSDVTAPPVTMQGGSPTIKLVTLYTTINNLPYEVNQNYASNFDGFVKALEGQGYVINSISGYSDRDIAGTHILSFHALGAAIDINPTQNPVGPADKNNLPSNISQLAHSFGLGWGGDWKSKIDPMHFSIAKSEGGSVPLTV